MLAIRVAAVGALQASFLACLADVATAQVIYEQWPHQNAGVASAGASGQFPEVRAADELPLPAGGVAAGVRWVGHTNEPEQLAGFLVQILRDDADGVPANEALLSAAVPVDALSPIALDPNGKTVNVQYTHAFAPLDLPAGQYYFSVGAITFAPETSGWRWNRSSVAANFLSWIETTIFTGFVPINPGDLSLQLVGPPGADDCADAAPIFEGTTPFDTTGATTDGPAHTPTQCTAEGSIYNDLWYRYSAGCDGLLVVETCDAATFDTALAVYVDEVCPPTAAQLLSCNDDGFDCGGGSSRLLLPVTSGTSYLVRVGAATSGGAGTGALTLTLLPSGPPAELRLDIPTAPVGYDPGAEITVTLSMAGLCRPAGGFTAELEFDPAALAFLGGTYTAEPFGLQVPLTSRITGKVGLSALAHPALSQTPSADDAILAELTFSVLRPLCIPPVAFRNADPGSRLLAPAGGPLPDHVLVVSPPVTGLLADVNADGIVDVDDLLEIILQWGPCDVPGPSCRADLDCSGTVDVDDLVTVILSWS